MAAKKRLRKVCAYTLVTSMLFTSMGSTAYAQTDLTLQDFDDVIGTYNIPDQDGNVIATYEEYIQSAGSKIPEKQIVIPADSYCRYEDGEDSSEKKPEILKDYEGKKGTSVCTTESGLIEYEFSVTEEGWYFPSLTYYPAEGSSSSIERAFFIDGELPYQQCADVSFERIFQCEITERNEDENGVLLGAWEQDNQGNDLKPSLAETPEWISDYLYDSEGYITSEMGFYLTKGEHTITIVSLKEPMILNSITLGQVQEIKDYEDVLASWDKEGAKDTSSQVIRIEAENADRTSSQMLYPTQDQSSPAVYPSSAKELKNNSIGGNSWRLTGQWIEWDFEAPEDGYYNISFFDKQNFVRGTYVSRKISIDGVVPFSEFEDYGFMYGQNWRYETLTNKEGVPYKVYLTKGSHTLRMEVVLGEFSEIVSDVQDIVTDLNSVYRKVIRITGVSPDVYRDYKIESSLPGLEEELIGIRDRLDDVIVRLRATAGKNSDKETVLITMRDELDELSEDVERFSKVIGTFKINVRACGNWITQVLDQPLQLDTIYITSPEEKTSIPHQSGWDSFLYELKRLYFSFVIDYNQVGNVADENTEGNTITLWVGTGRDQANVIKAMIDENFTNNTGINVNVMLVDVSTLLQATLAGQGPDVAIQVANDMPLNYGIRNAVYDLSKFDDLDTVLDRFNASACRAFQFNGSTYALPETQTYLMMFYRKDILAEIGLELPQTWSDVKVAMAKLNQNRMEFGMLPQEQVFSMFLYQNHGEYYKEGGKYSDLDSDEGINAFKEYCEYYTDYKLDKSTNAEERFRTGEAPIIISDISTYNNLQVSAPDIKGLWGMAAVPGVEEEDGTINHSEGSGGTACVIMNDTENPDDCWEFLKWWTDADTQVQFSREMESLMGAAARVATANNEAFVELDWPVSDLKTLLEQRDSLLGIPQVPGSYFTWRNINNAFYAVTTETDTISPREELMNQVIEINKEIRFKRDEFDLD